MKISRIAIPVIVASFVAAAPAAAAAAEFEGTVLSVNRDKRTFRLDDSERGIKRIKVTRNTRFERIDGFAGLRAGQRNIEVTARRRTAAGWRPRSSGPAAAATMAEMTTRWLMRNSERRLRAPKLAVFTHRRPRRPRCPPLSTPSSSDFMSQIDDFLGPRHRGAGRPPKLTDAELITLAVAQVLFGMPNDRQFLALARWRLGICSRG